MVRVNILKPPYTTSFSTAPQAISSAACPVGSIVCAESTDPLEAVAWLAEVVTEVPWLIPILGICDPSTVTSLRMLTKHLPVLRTRLATSCADGSPARGAWRAELVVAAVRKRPLPTALDMANFVFRRKDWGRSRSVIRELFRTALEQGTHPARSKATHSRVLTQLGPYTARDWITIARLASRIFAAHGGTRSDPIDLPPVEDRTLNAHCWKYLRLSRSAGFKILGWESVLETALRVGGYVSR